MKTRLCCLIFLIFLAGCATDQIDKPLEPIKFEKEQPYALDTTKLIESDPPSLLLMVRDSNGNYRLANDGETATFIAMSYEDSKKLAALVDLKNTYKNISNEQAFLINVERDKLTSIKEMMEIERQNRQNERQLRIDVEKAYKQERRDHRLDNIINRGTLVLTVIGGIAIAAL